MPPLTLLKHKPLIVFLLLLLSIATACAPQGQASAVTYSVDVLVYGQSLSQTVHAGSLVADALDAAAVELNLLDRVVPNFNEIIGPNTQIVVTRVKEELFTEELIVPFEQSTLRNESLPIGERRLLQAGQNGLAEVTTRQLFEDGQLVRETQINWQIIVEPIPEIIMLGVQAPIDSLALQGQMVFLSVGNAWLIEGASGARRPLISSGDLDGRIFSLSPDGQWLLFSRASQLETELNSLWLVSTSDSDENPINLNSGNVVHFADWMPTDSNEIYFSTVEYGLNPPGWLANNDLQSLKINASGRVISRREIIPANSDNLYSWWGTNFAIAPDGASIAIASADAIAMASLPDGGQETLLKITPFQSDSEWAWISPIAWSPDSQSLLLVEHAPQPGLPNQARSPLFNLIRIDIESQSSTLIQNSVGLFANPAFMPPDASSNGERFAFLQALNPLQSEISKYLLTINIPNSAEVLEMFPSSGVGGLSAQEIVWSPPPGNADQNQYIAMLFQGNIWIINIQNASIHQLSNDGLISRIDWRP